jgi:hypothetical protein
MIMHIMHSTILREPATSSWPASICVEQKCALGGKDESQVRLRNDDVVGETEETKSRDEVWLLGAKTALTSLAAALANHRLRNRS